MSDAAIESFMVCRESSRSAMTSGAISAKCWFVLEFVSSRIFLPCLDLFSGNSWTSFVSLRLEFEMAEMSASFDNLRLLILRVSSFVGFFCGSASGSSVFSASSCPSCSPPLHFF